MSITVVPGDGETWSTELDLDPTFDIKPYNATAGDLDGDGRDDLVLYGDETDERDGLYVALARDRGFAAPEQWYSSDLSDSLPRVGDFDGDGKMELVCFGENPAGDDTVRLLRPENGSFVMVAEKVLSGAGVAPLLAEWFVGDVDGDGADELVAPNAAGRVIFVYEIADDAFAPRTRWHTTSVPLDQARQNAWDSGVAGSALSDVDGDGDADLVELRYTANDNGPDDPLVLWVMLSDGSSFGDAQEWGGLDCSPECEDGFDLVD